MQNHVPILLLGPDRVPDVFRTAAHVVRHLTGAALDAVEGPPRS